MRNCSCDHVDPALICYGYPNMLVARSDFICRSGQVPLPMPRRRVGRPGAGWRANLLGVRWRFLSERAAATHPAASASDDIGRALMENLHVDTRGYESLLLDGDLHIKIEDSQRDDDDVNGAAPLSGTDRSPVRASVSSFADASVEDTGQNGDDGNDNEEMDDVCTDAETSGGDSDGYSHDQPTRSRSPSPVIIWRPSARVQLCHDVPPDLKSVFTTKQPSAKPPCQTVTRNTSPQTSRRSHRHRRQTVFPGSTFGGTRTYRKKPSGGRMPIDDDVDDDNASDDGTRLAMSDADRQRLAAVTAQIPNLFISKAYKVFIKEQKEGGDTRVPYYLKSTPELR